MTLNWKTWTLIGIVAVAVIAAIVWKQSETSVPTAGENQANQEAPITTSQDIPATATAVPATGNIDDAVAAVLAGIADDEASFADATNDATLVGADNQTITNLGQSFYENEI